jgi:hypothetical protein
MSRSQRPSEQESQLEADQAALEELRADLAERAQGATAPSALGLWVLTRD